ncbi:hypothetical protein OUZ56_033483 [Daphnia magna]|uniref:Uncharacterized protein n=1 Tax=Daphnia magna TaxID=35525 RepID=A0ABQ9ZXG4_9CRUS|nr:hypothetical protein OUZ56_033207 [Daphnia magna]KAK4017753.1 hypothetical protein OUZ56_033483 [Daphnia magna]
MELPANEDKIAQIRTRAAILKSAIRDKNCECDSFSLSGQGNMFSIDRTGRRPCTSSKGVISVVACLAVLMANAAADRCKSQSSWVVLTKAQKASVNVLFTRSTSPLVSGCSAVAKTWSIFHLLVQSENNFEVKAVP